MDKMLTPLRHRLGWSLDHRSLRRWAAVCAAILLGGAAQAQTPLELYDATIAADLAIGLEPVATLTSEVVLTGGPGPEFDFGIGSGDVTIEFIVEGDPSANSSSYLAVGSTPASSLRYEVWDNTGQLGFTQAGVADYQFTPGAPTPAEAAHVAYVWDPAATTMKVYVNGALAGTCTGVDSNFVMPAGLGRLGSNEGGEEGMVGKIHRVTVYDSVVPETALRRHASAFGAHVSKALTAYDAAVAADEGAGLNATAKLTSSVVMNGMAGADFDFGLTSGDATFEFIMEGDPSLGNSSFLAVGENSLSSLRFELWNDTAQVGFTQAAVADYPFTPGVASPLTATHLTYVWNATTLTMKMYVNGQLGGTTINISPEFAMPYGAGRLGANLGGVERMSGTIYRMTIYDDLLEDAAILRHAKAFTDVLRPPIINSFQVAPAAIAPGGSATLTWDVLNATQVLVNGVDRSTVSTLTVSPKVTTSYTLVARNAFGAASTQVRLQVNPVLTAYDAAIATDEASGLVPSAKLTAAVVLNGSGGAPFDFGANTGDITMEFIVEGDPSVGAATYLAVGENTTSNLRYEGWENTGLVGFTQLAVADYFFTPPVPSSTWPTHLTYAWNAAALTMSVYVNGSLAGTTTDVSDAFGMPSGQGWLGANPTGGESMVGTIYRVTVYPGLLPTTTILRHADAFLAAVKPALHDYDTAIAASAAGGLAPTARLFAPVTLTGVGGVTFHFGATSGDSTIEFILEGDPAAYVSSYLAVGTNSASSLRFELWENTGQLGFTQARVADYLLTPGVPSPTTATHITYAWNAATSTVKVYANGILAGTTAGVDPAFGMPTDLGVLGNNAGGTEPMIGTIHRVTVYDSLVLDDVILSHARAFTGVVQPPVLALDVSGTLPALTLTDGVAGAHYRLEYRSTLSAADPWQLLQDIPALSGTSIRVEDPTPRASQSQRYYRAVLVQ